MRHHSEQLSMMNTLNKTLTIAILVISTFISGINVDLVGPQNTAAGPAASRRLIVSSPYLNFGRVTAEDGLSKPIIVGELFMKTGGGILDRHGSRSIATRDSYSLTRYGGSDERGNSP